MVLPMAIAAGAQAIPAIAGLILANKKTGAERQLQGNVGQIQDLSNLMTNPNDPRYQAMIQNESQGIQQNYLSSLRDLIEANRRQALMGRQQIFDPERRDESMFSALVQGKQQAQQQANQNVLERLRNSIYGLYAGQNGINTLMKNQQGRQQNQLAALGAGSKLMGAMGGI